MFNKCELIFAKLLLYEPEVLQETIVEWIRPIVSLGNYKTN
jgi:hypothetical protein